MKSSGILWRTTILKKCALKICSLSYCEIRRSHLTSFNFSVMSQVEHLVKILEDLVQELEISCWFLQVLDNILSKIFENILSRSCKIF
jgi:hypothetical protein